MKPAGIKLFASSYYYNYPRILCGRDKLGIRKLGNVYFFPRDYDLRSFGNLVRTFR